MDEISNQSDQCDSGLMVVGVYFPSSIRRSFWGTIVVGNYDVFKQFLGFEIQVLTSHLGQVDPDG